MTRPPGMFGPALMILFAACPAFAQDAAFFGGTGCALIPVTGQAHVAELRCANELTTGEWQSDALLRLPDIIVGLSIDHAPGDLPDRFTITVPPGFYAAPPVMKLLEHTGGVVRVFPWVGM